MLFLINQDFSNSSSLTSFKVCIIATVPSGNAAVVAAIPVSLCKPLALNGLTSLPFILAVKNISSNAVDTMFVPVLIISAGKATKFPTGNCLKPLIKSDTNA